MINTQISKTLPSQNKMSKALINSISSIYDQSKRIVKSPSFSSFGIFAGGNIFVAVLGGLGGLIQARWLDPETFGEFRKYGILTMYLTLGYSFVHDGLIRQYPYLLGKGDHKSALQVASVAKWWYCFVTVVYVVLFVALAGFALFQQDYRRAIGWGSQVFGAIGIVYGAYLGVMYRTSSDFERLSYNNLISSLLATIQLVFVKIWGFWGLAIRFILMNLNTLWLNQRYLPIKVKAHFDYGVFCQLAKMSLRFSIPGYLHSSALIAAFNTLILCYCGEGGLGIYAFAVSIQGMAMIFSNSLSQMFYVKLSTKYGATEDVYKCLRYAALPAVLGVCLSCVLAVGMCVTIGPFIRFVLPKYVDSIAVIRILSIAVILDATALPLLVIGSALWYKTFAIKCVMNIGVALLAIALLPKTPCMVAVAAIIGAVVELTVGYVALFWNYRRR